MASFRITSLLAFVLLICSVECWPRKGKSQQPKETSFVGRATNELSTAILQSYIDDEKNIAFSPLGYAAILAILAEGSKGETKQQLVSSLHLPEDENLTRKTFHFIMERLKNTNKYQVNKPELKNWFYIYKNYTINDDYKHILEEHYLTEVKTVEKVVDDKNIEVEKPTKPNKKEEKLADVKTEESTTSQVEILVPENKPDIQEEIKPDIILSYEPTTVESTDEKLISFAIEDKPSKVPLDQQYLKPAKNIKEKIKLIKYSEPSAGEYGTEEEETMIADEARVHTRVGKGLYSKNDITSSLSVNTVGKKANSAASESLMLLFNGMYFRGAWKKPFDVEELGTFYKSSSEKIQVPMMKTIGKFKTGTLPGLDSVAIELPYDGGRYALTLVVPRARDGLVRLIADLPDASLPEIQSNLIEETCDVSIPSFFVEITTKPISALAKFGVSSIFSPSADLSGISKDLGLFVQEMVQHVTVKVDNEGSSVSEFGVEDLVTSAIELSKSAAPIKKFSVEHPFVFFIHDILDHLVIAAGKITEPKQQEPFLP